MERLADKFSAVVVMPASALESFDDCDRLTGNDLIARLNAKADELNVSSSALRRRLAALGKLKKASARAIPDDALRNNGGEDKPPPPPLCSREFAEVVAIAID